MADVSVRPARLPDVEHVVRVQREVWSQPAASVFALPPIDDLDSDAMTRAWERAVLLPPTPRHRLLVAESGGSVVGVAATTASTDPEIGQMADELVLLVVDPPHQRQGHGSRLMQAVADLVGQTDINTLTAWLPAAADDVRGYFELFGWAADGAYRTVEIERNNGPMSVRELRFSTTVN